MKQIFAFFLVVLAIAIKAPAQEKSDKLVDFVSPRLNFDNDLDQVDHKSELAYTVSSQDTFYIEREKDFDMSYFLKIKASHPNFLSYYQLSVFYYSTRNSTPAYLSLQWKVPIVIYFDKDIPKNIQRKVERFYETMDEIPNFSLSFTNRAEEANYQVKLTSETLFVDPQDQGFKNEAEQRRFLFNGCNYFIISDASKGIIGCNLKINTAELDNEAILLAKIKQGLFLSFGRFFMIDYFNVSDSFLNNVYDNQKTLSPIDLEILKMHYSQIFDEAIDGSQFKQLLNN